MTTLEPEKLDFASGSLVDPGGRVFHYRGRVFRLVSDPRRAEIAKELLQSGHAASLFSAGLVQTWIPGDVQVAGAALVLEHRRIPFESHPAEFSQLMHWQAARCVAGLAATLNSNGWTLMDAHPWNIMFEHGKPVFIDFGSIIEGSELGSDWHEEFYRYFAAPLWLAARGFTGLAGDYRREHRQGFGLRLMQNRLIRKISRYFGSASVSRWLEANRPSSGGRGEWSDYEQAHGSAAGREARTEKQVFVQRALEEQAPGKVLDCAANNGFYAVMAAGAGAEVAAFDYQEDCVDTLCERARDGKLSITPAKMDFTSPTPPFGLGLEGRSAFERYHSDMTLVLGLVHHVCITQRLPIGVFCRICSRFSSTDILLEFVHPSDKHLSNWRIPDEYCLETVQSEFAALGWNPVSREDIRREGIDRSMVHFQKGREGPAY